MFNLLAEQLNDNGLSMQKVLKPSVEILWTPESVKEYLWRPVQKAMLNKQSTTELESKEIDQVFQILNKHLGEKFGIVLEFPSEDHDENK
jgi:hypothetical protein